MRSRVLFLALALPLLAVGGCTTLGNIGTVVGINSPQFLDNVRLGQIHASRETFQAGLLSIRKNFPQCRASQTPSATDLCYKRDTYLALQTIERQVTQTVENIDAWAMNNPTIDAGALIDAFNRVVGQGTALVSAVQAGKG